MSWTVTLGGAGIRQHEHTWRSGGELTFILDDGICYRVDHCECGASKLMIKDLMGRAKGQEVSG